MFIRKALPILLVILVVAVAIPQILKRTLMPELPSFGQMPTYSFTNQNGSIVSNETALGKVQLVNFFFTSCPGPCPRLMADISQIEHKINNPKLEILSISVDPKRDSQEVLKNYSSKFPAKAATWNLATSDKYSIKEFSEKGLKLALGEDIGLHSTKVVLVDSKGNVRGLFNPNSESEPLLIAINSLF